MNCLHCKSYAVSCTLFVCSVNYKILHDDASQKNFFFSFFFPGNSLWNPVYKGNKGTHLSVCITIIKWTVRINFIDKALRVATVGEKPEKNNDY